VKTTPKKNFNNYLNDSNITKVENYDLSKFLNEMFNDLFMENKNNYFQKAKSIKYLNINNHPFFALILKQHEEFNKFNKVLISPENLNRKIEKLYYKNSDHKYNIFSYKQSNELCKSCDEVFCEFFLHVYSNGSRLFLTKVLKLLLLMRIFINKYKNIQLEIYRKEFPNIKILEELEFTEYFDPENVPDICNEFISEYLYNLHYFEDTKVIENNIKNGRGNILIITYKDFVTLDKIDTKEVNNCNETVEIIQYLCFWLQENKYTDTKITLYKKYQESLINKINE